MVVSSQQAQLEETRAVGVAELGLQDRRIKLSRSDLVLGVEQNVECRVQLHRVLDDSETAQRAVVQNLDAQGHQALEEREIPQVRDALPSLNQHILQSRYDRLDVIVVLSGIHVHDVRVEMRVESRRVDVEHLTLSGEDCEDCLNAVQLLAISQVDVLDQMIEHFNQVGEELDVDDVGESKMKNY